MSDRLFGRNTFSSYVGLYAYVLAGCSNQCESLRAVLLQDVNILHTSIQTNIISAYLCRGCTKCTFDRETLISIGSQSGLPQLLSGSKSEGPVYTGDLLVVEVYVNLLYSNRRLFLGDLVLECYIKEGLRERWVFHLK